MTPLGEGIIITAGSIPDSVIDSATRTHYYPNVTANISLQTFVPLSLQPNAVIVRCRQGFPPGTAIQCRVFDSVGTPVPVGNANVSIDGIVNFLNKSFPINGSTANFPAFGIWTVELDFSKVDIAGIVLCYKPSFPFILAKDSSQLGCSTTIVIS